MDERTAIILSNYILGACATLTLFLILPAASAAAHRLHPGWRAWVFPWAFVSLIIVAILNISNLQVTNSYPLDKLAILTTGLSLNFFVLNALYRALIVKAWRLAMLVWLAYLLFLGAVFLFNSVLVLTVYEVLCATVLFVLYGSVFVREHEKAADVLPIFIGTGIIVLAVAINSFVFAFSLGFIVISQAFLYHILQSISLFFFLKGGFHFYNIKYAEQRNMERVLLANKQ